jgi:hypothetical protein
MNSVGKILILYHNLDKPEKIATKAQKHKGKRETFWLNLFFVSWCLSGENVLP